MFFQFMPEIEYPPAKWILVWEAEKALQALILADADLIRSASDHEIIEAVFRILQGYEYSRATLLIDDAASFISDFVGKGLPTVKVVVGDLFRIGLTKEFIKTRLMPTDRLRLCIQNNNVFREHILRGRGALGVD